jgi:ABC-type branched-subunit amino acid transport system substrate-binding protein
MKETRTVRRRRRYLTCAAASAALGVAACGSSPGSSSTSSVVAGVALPLTGEIAAYGGYFESGIRSAAAEINADGGIDGHKLVLQIRDTEGDPVDAASAVRSLLPYHPNVFLGSSGLDQLGIVGLFESYKVPDFFGGGITALDNMTYKYVFRVNSSDNLVAAAMAQAAINLKCMNAAVLFSNDTNSLAELPVVLSVYRKLGGDPTVVEFNPQSHNFSSEVAKAFAGHPGCLILHANQDADGPIFAAQKQLGDMTVPILGDLPGATLEMRSALGLSDSVKYLYGFSQGSTTDPADAVFLHWYQKVYGPLKQGQVVDNSAYAYYDGTIIPALAMVAAHSTVPTVYVNYVTKISNPPGTACYSYAACVSLLKAGKKINYQGAWGDEDFNEFHNVFQSYAVTRWNPDGSLKNLYVISASTLKSLSS